MTLARVGQEFVIKNSAPVSHNAKWESVKNGAFNPLIPAGGEFKIPAPLVAERSLITLSCSIHPWMSAWIRVFDHPYYALTDENGKFEIPLAPAKAGKLRFFIFAEGGGFHGGNDGRFGETIEVKPGSLDLGQVKYAPKSN